MSFKEEEEEEREVFRRRGTRSRLLYRILPNFLMFFIIYRIENFFVSLCLSKEEEEREEEEE